MKDGGQVTSANFGQPLPTGKSPAASGPNGVPISSPASGPSSEQLRAPASTPTQPSSIRYAGARIPHRVEQVPVSNHPPTMFAELIY
jgi:hypothetical protein